MAVSRGVQVHQSPSALVRKPGDDVQLVCTHERVDFRVMLWYLQPPGHTAIKLIGSVEYDTKTYEESYERNFNISGDLSRNTAKNVSLHIVDVKQSEHSAVYYCAARQAQ